MKRRQEENVIYAGSRWDSAGSTDDNSRIPTDCTFTAFSLWFLVLFVCFLNRTEKQFFIFSYVNMLEHRLGELMMECGDIYLVMPLMVCFIT